MDIAEQNKQKMQGTIDHFKQELKQLRSSRANPAILDGVFVEVYGSPMRLRDLANVTTPEPRQLMVSPFDPHNVNAISKGIERANLNLQPMVDGHVVRINIPPMDEATRKEIVKQAKKKVEDAKVAIREIRRKNNELVRKKKTDGDIPEDIMKKTEKTIQEQTDKFCKELDDLFAAKEKEILTV